MRPTIKMLLSTVAVGLGIVGTSQAAIITYTDFSSTAGLTLNGNAAQAGDVLRVTPATFNQAGSVFSTSAVSLAANVSFSTAFQFRFSNPGGSCDGVSSCGADGLVFMLQTNSNSVGGLGGGIGFAGVPNSVGIEFDTWNNGGVDGNSSNHVGINVGGDINSLVRAQVPTDMNNGAVWSAWVDYNGATDLLEVRLSETNVRPLLALLSLTRDLAVDLGSTNAFVGFSSGTGSAFANHDVLNWTFVDAFAPINNGNVPEPASLALLGLGLAGLGFSRSKRC